MKKYTLEISVFLAGAVVMMLEMAGSRVLAPYLGSSIVTWTSLIGVILGSLSLGYWFGGRLADKGATNTGLAKLLLGSAVAVFVLVLSKDIVLAVATKIKSTEISSLLASILIFSPASILLGMVSPYAAKIKISSLESSGSAVGSLYAISTMGSIVGTFVAGFFLLGILGNTALIFSLVAVLIAASILVSREKFLFLRMLLVFGVFTFIFLFTSARAQARSSGEFDFDTKYNWFLVKDTPLPYRFSLVPGRILTTNYNLVQSGVYTGAIPDLPFEYSKYYRLAEYFSPEVHEGKALLLGGGAFSVGKDFLRRNPSAKIDIVEIDDQLPQIAKQYFGLTEDPRMNIVIDDARRYMNTTSETYNAIFIDIFNNTFALPFHVTTKEMVQHLYDHLTSDGSVMVNIVSAPEGDNAKFLRAEYYTYASVFPQVYLFQAEDKPLGEGRQNIMLVALKSSAVPAWHDTGKGLNTYLKTRILKEQVKDVPVLTDDFAPVEKYLMNYNI